jgi:hypothetical protein
MIEFSPPDLDSAWTALQEIPRNDWYAMLAGTAAFSSTLAASTYALHHVLHISTATIRPVPTLCGMASVCLASLTSHQAAIATSQYLTNGRLPSLGRVSRRAPINDSDSLLGDYSYSRHSQQQPCLDLYYLQIPLHTLRICCLGLLTFKLLGGRFWSVAPSSYVHLGSFARPRLFSLKASPDYATDAQRLAMQRMGRLAGCHTCGTRMLFQRPRFHGDVREKERERRIAKGVFACSCTILSYKSFSLFTAHASTAGRGPAQSHLVSQTARTASPLSILSTMRRLLQPPRKPSFQSQICPR